MIIDDPESFRTWLTAKLGPLCDADPEALAKYVYALVKKDKPIEELRASMVEQLEVFLQRETQNFVNLLFRTLETQKFELSQENVVPPPSTPAAPPAVTKPALVDVDLREPFSALGTQEETAEKKPLKEANSDGIMATIASSAHNSNSLGCVLLAASNRREPEKHLRKADSDKDDRVPRRIRRRGSSPSPERRRSRSRSFERRRSRSRERDRARAWRNKSPPLRRYDRSRRSFSKSPPRRFSKSGSPQSKRASRRSYSKSPHRRYSKSRSPQSKRIRYRNRSPPHSRSRTRSRTRSRSPLIPGIRDRKDVATGLSPRENHGDTDLRNVQSVVNLPTDLQPPYTRRCRDFDEKGFCVRGDLCPYDHGTDPVVLEDLQMYNGGPAQQPPLIPPTAPPPTHMRHPVHPPMRPPPTVNLIEYNPDAPSMEPRMWARPPSFRGPMMRGMMRGNMGRGGFPTHQRELINVVTGGPHFRHQRPNPNPLNDFSNGRLGNADSKPFDFNRLGGPRAPFNNQKGFTSLQLKKVPPGVNNITHLNSHFSKFGKIVNIQVGFEGDPESALITFSSPTEANIAYKSTEAVLNNRFIRVFWYNPAQNSGNNENKQENTPPTTRPSVLERLGDIPSKVLNNIQPSAVQTDEKAQVTLGVNNSLSKTLYIPSAMKKELPKEQTKENPSGEAKVLPGELLKKKIEQVAVAKKKQQESIKAGLKLNADLRKRKTELLEKQINQQKLLIQRMEAPNVTPQQKAALMETIKTLQDSIENIRKDLESSVKPSAAKVDKTHVVKNQLVPFVKKSREETQRELLDAELDLINSQNEGKNADELKKKVADLKMRAISCGLTTTTTTRGAFRGRGTIRIRGRGRGSKFSSSYDHNVVDHRPTKVLVSGYEQDDKADVLTHFEKYGQVVDYISDDATPSLVLNFKSRKEAENAINKGRNFHDRLLSVTWATSNMNIRVGVVTKPPTPVQRSIRVMEDDVIGDDILEVDDDDAFVDLSPAYFPIEGEYEEDEEDEERSWRR